MAPPSSARREIFVAPHQGEDAAKRSVPASELAQANGCEVVLSPAEYAAFKEMLNEPPQVIPGFAALLRARRNR